MQDKNIKRPLYRGDRTRRLCFQHQRPLLLAHRPLLPGHRRGRAPAAAAPPEWRQRRRQWRRHRARTLCCSSRGRRAPSQPALSTRFPPLRCMTKLTAATAVARDSNLRKIRYDLPLPSPPPDGAAGSAGGRRRGRRAALHARVRPALLQPCPPSLS